jgi:hypothetical protein
LRDRRSLCDTLCSCLATISQHQTVYKQCWLLLPLVMTVLSQHTAAMLTPPLTWAFGSLLRLL